MVCIWWCVVYAGLFRVDICVGGVLVMYVILCYQIHVSCYFRIFVGWRRPHACVFFFVYVSVCLMFVASVCRVCELLFCFVCRWVCLFCCFSTKVRLYVFVHIIGWFCVFVHMCICVRVDMRHVVNVCAGVICTLLLCVCVFFFLFVLDMIL